MVNEYVILSPKKKKDSSDHDLFYQKTLSKPIESSDDETTSSSLLPLPDTLEDIRNELKTTINNICETTEVKDLPKSSNVRNQDLTNQTAEKEDSLTQKINAANMILDGLLTGSRTAGKNQLNESTMSEPSTESSEFCPRIPVTPFIVGPEWCPCEMRQKKPDWEPPETERRENRRKPKKKWLEKMRTMRMRCKRSRKTSKGRPSEASQTQTDHCHYGGHATEGLPRFVYHVGQQHCPRRINSYIPKHPLRHLPSLPERLRESCTCSIPPAPPECIGPTEDNKTKPPSAKIKTYGGNRKLEEPNVDEKNRIKKVKTNSRHQEGIDFYYFDHGNSAYYQTTDGHPAKCTEFLIERTDEYATRFWAEIFGTVTIAFTFVISFILQLYRCLFTAVIRGLTVGLIQIFSDYFFKPFLAILFNGLIQPCLILGYNIATSTRDFCIPVCEICNFFARDVAIIFGSCRLIEVNQGSCSNQSCNCKHSV